MLRGHGFNTLYVKYKTNLLWGGIRFMDVVILVDVHHYQGEVVLYIIDEINLNLDGSKFPSPKQKFPAIQLSKHSRGLSGA